MITLFTEIFIKFFFLFTPFFLLSSFLSLTSHLENSSKRKIAIKSTFATLVICIVLLFLGDQIFSVFGITLDSFRVGTGILLFFSAISLVQGPEKSDRQSTREDISVVPLSIPITVGPATTGALLILGGELDDIPQHIAAIAAIGCATFCITLLLLAGGYIKKIIKYEGLSIMSRITGLILSALAAQMIMTGIRNFLSL